MPSMATPRPTGADADGRSLQELAVDVVQDIHKLATGLAHAGAAPKVTAQIEQTSALYAGIAKALASGPVGAQPSSPGAGPESEPGAPPQSGAAPQPPGGPPAPMGAPAPPPNPGAAVPGPGTPLPQSPAQGGLHNAIAQMHSDAQAAATKTAGK